MSITSRIQQHHRHALALLGHGSPSPDTLKLLRQLAAQAYLLWQTGHGEPVSIEAFCAALQQLSGAPSGPAMVHVLDLLQYTWRGVPATLLAGMAVAYQGAADKTVADLEIRHISAWIQASAPQAERLAQASITSLLAQAEAWQANHELVLRQQSSAWSNPVSGLAHAGYRLEPILSTLQLADSEHHHGVLCNLKVRDECRAGLAAYFLVQANFAQARPDICLVGLGRADAQADWEYRQAFAPPACKAEIEAVALSLLNQANAALRLQRLRTLAGQALTLPGARQLLSALLQAAESKPPA